MTTTQRDAIASKGEGFVVYTYICETAPNGDVAVWTVLDYGDALFLFGMKGIFIGTFISGVLKDTPR